MSDQPTKPMEPTGAERDPGEVFLDDVTSAIKLTGLALAAQTDADNRQAAVMAGLLADEGRLIDQYYKAGADESDSVRIPGADAWAVAEAYAARATAQAFEAREGLAGYSGRRFLIKPVEDARSIIQHIPTLGSCKYEMITEPVEAVIGTIDCEEGVIWMYGEKGENYQVLVLDAEGEPTVRFEALEEPEAETPDVAEPYPRLRLVEPPR